MLGSQLTRTWMSYTSNKAKRSIESARHESPRRFFIRKESGAPRDREGDEFKLNSALAIGLSPPTSLMSSPQDNLSHLFVSYANEDVQLAKWLARKLAARGYAVWFDQMKMLGGEPWPQTIDDAIKHRTFRMLALMSANSFDKPNPTKERTAALAVGKARKIPDFLITLKVDAAELDWQTSDISYVSFVDSWAEGLRQLFEKLDAIHAPRILDAGASIAASTFPRGDDLVLQVPELLSSNVIRVGEFPPTLKVFRLANALDSKQRSELGIKWPHYRINDDVWVALHNPPPEFSSALPATPEQCLWTDAEFFHGVRARDIAANLIMRVLGRRLLDARLRRHAKRDDIYFAPADFTQDGQLHFPSYTGKNTWLKIRGNVTFRKSGGQSELNFHHFAFRLTLARGLDQFFYVQITPTLVFFDTGGRQITDSSVGSRRRRMTKMWFNHKWFVRLLAAKNVLVSLPQQDGNDVVLEEELLTMSSPFRLNEPRLAPDDDEQGDADEDIEVELDERETEQADE